MRMRGRLLAVWLVLVGGVAMSAEVYTGRAVAPRDRRGRHGVPTLPGAGEEE